MLTIADMLVIQLLQCRLWENIFLYAMHEIQYHPKFHRGSAIPAYEQFTASKQTELQFGSTSSDQIRFLQCCTFEHCGNRSHIGFHRVSSIPALPHEKQENQFESLAIGFQQCVKTVIMQIHSNAKIDRTPNSTESN